MQWALSSFVLPVESDLMKSAMSTLTKKLLRHLVALTRHRDHQLLDLAVVTGLHDMTGSTQVRLFDIIKHRDRTLLQPRIWVEQGRIVTREGDTAPTTGEPIEHYPELQEGIRQRLDFIAYSATSWVPLWLNDVAVGCIQMVTDQLQSDEQKHIATGIVDVYRNQRNLLDYSERDSLTGLLNRKTFDDKFSILLSAQASSAARLATGGLADGERRLVDTVSAQWLAVVDIDFFKRVNDEFGHVYGDEVLILVANLLRTSFRAHDLTFRFGGEEFVILLRSCSLDQARGAFERFRANVEAHHFPQLGTVTITLGFASVTDETPVAILGHADQALYFGKAHGRNQICFYDELVREGLLDVPKTTDDEVFFFDDFPEVESASVAATDLNDTPATR